MVKVRSEATKVRVSTEVDMWLVRQRGLAGLEGMKSKWPRERARSMTLESEMGRSEIGFGYGTLGEGENYCWQTNRLIHQRILTSNGDLVIESTVIREYCVGSRQTPHRPNLMDDSLRTHRSKPFFQFLEINWDQQNSMPRSHEVKSFEHLPANSLFVISFQSCMIAISGTYIELNEFTYASWYAISILVSDICDYSWNDILNLKETVVTILFSKVIEDSFQDSDVLEGGAINLSLNGSSIVQFITVLNRVRRFWKFISKLSFFVAIIWAMLEIKDDLRWVPPGCFWCLLVLETQVIVVIGDDVSGLKGRNAYVENEITNFWLIGNLKGKKL